jgi:ferredoxin-NADP reductase
MHATAHFIQHISEQFNTRNLRIWDNSCLTTILPGAHVPMLELDLLCGVERAFSVAEIVRNEALSNSVRRIVFQPAEPLTFKPGQFVTIRIPDAVDPLCERSYSIASGINDTLPELCVVKNENGVLSPTLCNLQVGDRIETTPALGNFVLPDTDHKPLCLICTGTGIAPFRAILRSLPTPGATQREIHLISGNRTREDCLYHAEWLEMQMRFPGFRYHPVLSREQVEGYDYGYLHQVYERLFSDGRDAVFMVCGWSAMLSEARRRLKALGYNRRQYHFESYDG